MSDSSDEAEIQELADVFRRTRGDMRAVMRALLGAPWFRSRKDYFGKLKSPIELVISTVRLTGSDRLPAPDTQRLVDACAYMAQEPFNPPSVKGWDGGLTWIDTGLLVERLNFAAAELADPTQPGIARFVARVAEGGWSAEAGSFTEATGAASPNELAEGGLVAGGGPGAKADVVVRRATVAEGAQVVSPEAAVAAAASFLGPLELSESVRASLVDHVAQDGPLTFRTDGERRTSADRLSELLQLTSATQSYQFN